MPRNGDTAAGSGHEPFRAADTVASQPSHPLSSPALVADIRPDLDLPPVPSYSSSRRLSPHDIAIDVDVDAEPGGGEGVEDIHHFRRGVLSAFDEDAASDGDSVEPRPLDALPTDVPSADARREERTRRPHAEPERAVRACEKNRTARGSGRRLRPANRARARAGLGLGRSLASRFWRSTAFQRRSEGAQAGARGGHPPHPRIR